MGMNIKKSNSMARYRKTVIKIHMASIGLWLVSSVIMLLGAVLNADDWINSAHTYVFNPAMMVAMVTGIYLVLVTKGKIFKKGWFLLKVVLLISSMLYMGLYLTPLIKEGSSAVLIYSVAGYVVLLLIVLFLSLRKPRRHHSAKVRKDVNVP